MTYQVGLVHGVMITCLFCAVATYIHYRGLHKTIAEQARQYAADLALADKRCAQLVRANNVLSIRAAKLERAITAAHSGLARGVPPDIVRATLANSTC